MNNPINQKSISRYVKLKDYKVFDYEIPEIFLDFVINKNVLNFTTKLKFVKKNKNTKNLILDGTDILIKKIFIDDSLLEEEDYKQQKNNLKIKNINKDNFLLKIEGIIKPKENISLLGMYESNGIITTQCEAEGFRRISFHSDRPDILSKYIVRIEADKNDYPVLLSNGNVVKENNLANNRHEIIWEDPYPKPSYLFALVAGKLNCVKDNFITKSNRKVKINNDINILVGTQLISKGFHFPNLNCIIVLDIDLSSMGHDLRSSEKNLQLYHQLSGRAGRAGKPATVYFQTYNLNSKTINQIVNQDPFNFLENELEIRKKYN